MSLLPFGDLPRHRPRRFVSSSGDLGDLATLAPLFEQQLRASMTLELLGSEFLEACYVSEEARRARRDHLEGILKTLAWVAQVRNEWERL